MNRLIKRTANAWQRHGFYGFVRLIFKNILYQPSRILRGVRDGPGIEVFDAAHGTETSGIREVGSLDIVSPNARHAVRYQPSSEALTRNAISRLEIEPSAFTFIDFGSGKGRVLMIAAEYPFKQVIGIEFSAELNQIAKRNIACLPSNLNPPGRISILECDAAEFEPPPGDLVCYFYNPFGAAVLAPIVEKLVARSLDGCRTIIIYVDPQHRELFEGTGKFKVRHIEPSLLIFAT